MAGINSRAKGNKAERDLAKQFKEWTGKDFARTPSSGGLSWQNSMVSGDIVCTTEGHFFPFSVEVKFHKEIDTNNLLVGKKDSKIVEFWKQCKHDAQKAKRKKIPILLMRYNNLPRGEWIVGLATETWEKLELPSTEKGNVMFVTNKDLEGGSMVLFNSSILFGSNYRKIKKTVKPKRVWRQVIA